jgi:hypothetical protein
MQTAETQTDPAAESVEPPPTGGRKLQRRVVKPAAAPTAPPAESTPSPPEAAATSEASPAVPLPDDPPATAEPPASASPWALSRTFGPGVQIRATDGRCRATIHLVRTGRDGDPIPRMTQRRQELRDQLTAKVRSHAESTAAFADFSAIRAQLQAHQTEAKLAKATAEELAARRKRLELGNEANLAAQLQAIDRELEDFAVAQAKAEQAVATLAPIVEQRRALAEREAARAVEPALAEIRNELKAKENEILAALMSANAATLDDLVVYDGLLRFFSAGSLGAKDVALAVLGE